MANYSTPPSYVHPSSSIDAMIRHGPLPWEHPVFFVPNFPFQCMTEDCNDLVPRTLCEEHVQVLLDALVNPVQSSDSSPF